MNEHPRNASHGHERLAVAFLVRCWREGDGWRFQMENVATRERQGFATVVAFLEALEQLLDEGSRKLTG